MTALMPPVLGEGTDPRNLARAIAFCRTHRSEHHIPLLQAVGVGAIAYAALTDRLARPNTFALGRSRRASLIMVGDDDASVIGPLGWVAADQLVRWARGAMVHGTGGCQPSYRLAVSMAQMTGRFVLIETSSDASDAWAEIFDRAGVPTLLLRPAGGGVHPIEPDGVT